MQVEGIGPHLNNHHSPLQSMQKRRMLRHISSLLLQLLPVDCVNGMRSTLREFATPSFYPHSQTSILKNRQLSTAVSRTSHRLAGYLLRAIVNPSQLTDRPCGPTLDPTKSASCTSWTFILLFGSLFHNKRQHISHHIVRLSCRVVTGAVSVKD